MQGFLSATQQAALDGRTAGSASSSSASSASLHHHGAHHPLATSSANLHIGPQHGAVKPVPPPPPHHHHNSGGSRMLTRRLSPIAKLVLFAVVSLVALAYVLVGPSPLSLASRSSPPERNAIPNTGNPKVLGVSGLQRVDDHTPPPPPKDNSAYLNAFFAVTPVGVCPETGFTLEQVSQHRTLSDLWLVVHGMVLNVTAFVPSHPGGRAILEGASEDDAEVLFSQYHSPSTLGLFKNFCIGKLRRSEASY